MILDKHLSERTHAIAAAVLLGELAHGNFREISLNGVGEERLIGLCRCGSDRCQHQCNSEASKCFSAHVQNSSITERPHGHLRKTLRLSECSYWLSRSRWPTWRLWPERFRKL